MQKFARKFSHRSPAFHACGNSTPDRISHYLIMRSKAVITDVPIDNFNYDEVLDKIDKIIKNNHKAYIVTVNPEMIINASRDERFFEILQNSTINTPDGVGILWAAYYLSLKKYKSAVGRFFQVFYSLLCIAFAPKKIRSILKERVTGTDLLPKIINRSQDKKWKIFLLGAKEGIAKHVAKKFTKIYPNSQFVGYFAGSPHRHDEKEICEQINQVEPDILFIAYGAPKQEFWIHRNLFKLESVKLAVGIGGAFDFYAGKQKRAPKLFRKIGLEWLWRLVCDPKRFVRIWNATARFVKLIMKNKQSNVK